MATELDQMMDEAIQALTGEGGMLPLTTFEPTFPRCEWENLAILAV